MRTTSAYDASLARRATGLLASFNRAGLLTAADVHVAQRVGAIGGESDEVVLLAVALVVRSTRLGSVVVDLATAAATTTADAEDDRSAQVGRGIGQSGSTDEAEELTWPADLVERMAASPLVGGPIRMVGSQLWLARYWDQEQQVAAQVLARSGTETPGDVDPAGWRESLRRLVDPQDTDQAQAVTTCVFARFSVLAGGPGTGKTTTVSRLLAVLRELDPSCRVALAAPTGKAAARLEQAVRSSSVTLPAEDRERLGELAATTLHKLLGWLPGSRTRFRHDHSNPLPLDVVVIDEASMVSLTMMARLLDALRPTARLVLVGDPDQLASVEAGAVLADLVSAPRLRPQVATLTRNHRFSATSGIARLAVAVHAGDGQQALQLLRDGGQDLTFVDVADDAVLSAAHLKQVRDVVVQSATAMQHAALAGDGQAALAALDQHRLLCAHRRGPRGVERWDAQAAAWSGQPEGSELRADGRYCGEPLLVTRNDHATGLNNGDTGVVIDDGGGGLIAVFGRGGAPIRVPLARLGAVRTMHAMTVHRSQGSQFDQVSVLLPAEGSPLGTRQTLYTAVTRATDHVRVIGSAAALVRAIETPAARATGLRERLDA